jgi:hypothetical protein
MTSRNPELVPFVGDQVFFLILFKVLIKIDATRRYFQAEVERNGKVIESMGRKQ